MMKVWLERFSNPSKFIWSLPDLIIDFLYHSLVDFWLRPTLLHSSSAISKRKWISSEGGHQVSREATKTFSDYFFFWLFHPSLLLCICFHQQVKERFRLGLKWEILENENVWNECQVEGKSSKSLVDCPTERSQITQIKYDLLTWWDLYNFLSPPPTRSTTFAYLPTPGSLFIHATRHEDFQNGKINSFSPFYHPSSANKGRWAELFAGLEIVVGLSPSSTYLFFLLSVPPFILIAFSHFPLAKSWKTILLLDVFSFLPFSGRRRRENYAQRKENNLLTWKIHIKNSFQWVRIVSQILKCLI